MKKNLFKIIALAGLFAETLSAQNTQIKGFMNVNVSAVFDTTNRNYLSLGQYDLFITSQITDKVSFLGETIFEYKNGFAIGLERAIINYQIKDYFYATIGKQHVPLGYWNKAYHHGLVLQPTIIRPSIVRRNIGGDWLPLEDMAVQFNGGGISKFNFGYNLMIGNGIASNVIEDFNQSKAVCINIHAEPIDNLKFYVSGYADNIPADATTLQGILLTQNANLQILNGSIAYMNGRFPVEFIGEYYNLRTQMLDSNTNASSNGYLLYLGYKLKKTRLVPYLTYDAVQLDSNEKYFLQNNTSSFTLGLRYVMHPLSVIKLEFKNINAKDSGMQNRIDLQFAIGF